MLSPDARARYSRHLLVTEIGEAGQARLLATRVKLCPGGHPLAAEVATRYLEAAGVCVTTRREPAVGVMVPSAEVLAAREPRPELEAVEAALAGALAALDVVRGTLGWERRR